MMRKTGWTKLKQACPALQNDLRGQIAIIFAFAALAIFVGLGAGIDLSRAYAARQRLSQVATLACQYSTRPSVGQTAASNNSGSNGFQNYVAAVNAFAAVSLTSQHWNAATPTGAGGTPGAYFTATPATGGSSGSAAAATPTNPVVEMSADIPTAFAKILKVNTITVHTRIACQTLANAPQITNPPTLLKEGFEVPCGGFCFSNPNGGSTTISTPTQTFPAVAGYVGYNGFKWFIVGYCLETDAVGVINPSVPEQTHAAELDCDNGSGSKGNSSISTQLYLEPGQYEIRYNYRSRIDYPAYDPAYICGSTAADVSWANDSSGYSPGTGSNVSRTNQINVYLDANIAGTNGSIGSAPLHKTSDGTQFLGGQNLIDTCVYTPSWIERSIRVKVSTPAYYWLSFAADGVSDSYGGQIDNIRLCQGTCAGSLQDNFPPSWTAANNSGVNKVLFEDTFESPVYSSGSSPPYTARNGNLGLSLGTSGTASSGWPSQTASGWSSAPFNQATYQLKGAAQGAQYINLDGFNANGNAKTDRLISRPFLLDPGYYQVSYNYIPMVSFAPYVTGTYCTYAPAAGSLYPATPTVPGTIRFYTTINTVADTNIIGVFMSHSMLVSTPLGGNAQGSATSYTNPDGSVSTTPVVPPDAVNYANYNPSVPNPLLDTCGSSDTWLTRTVNIQVRKPGLYWLSFSSQGTTADNWGGAIDDVKLTALGSPYLSSAPAAPVVSIPVPTPQTDTSLAVGTYSGFTIVADPFAPPAVPQ